jgi:hypothetical protein
MFDQFLTSVLQIVIVVDVIGVIAYFVLSGMRNKNNAGPSRSLLSYLPWHREPSLVPATSSEFDQLRQVLYGFRQGLT